MRQKHDIEQETGNSTLTEINFFREKLQNLISKFNRDKTHYLSKGYPEAQVRLDFINQANR